MSWFKSQNIRRIRGCNYSIFKDDIFKVNGFNEEITSWGREDSEFVQRLFNIGVKKQHLKFSAIQYHLWHDEANRRALEVNDKLLQKAIVENLDWCEQGINKFL